MILEDFLQRIYMPIQYYMKQTNLAEQTFGSQDIDGWVKFG